MSSTFTLLLPPSEGKEAGGVKGTSTGAFDKDLKIQRHEVVGALKKELATMTHERAEALFKAHGALADRALHDAKALVANKAPVMPAWQRYSGVVWSHLHPESLSASRRAQIVIPSGLYGLTTANDLIADYRLTMLVGLEGIGNLGAFWRQSVSRALASACKNSVVIDLLPNEHRKAVDPEVVGALCRIVTVDFVAHSGAGAAGHGAKAVKGAMARAILDDGIDRLGSFRWEGWRAAKRGDAVTVRAPKA